MKRNFNSLFTNKIEKLLFLVNKGCKFIVYKGMELSIHKSKIQVDALEKERDELLLEIKHKESLLGNVLQALDAAQLRNLHI